MTEAGHRLPPGPSDPSRPPGGAGAGGAGAVGPAGLERALAAVRAAAAGPAAGVFGPGSVTWRVDREAFVFLGAGAALLLQLAHPWVAAGVARHSVALDDPIGRFHRTFGLVHAMAFGTLDGALAAARRLHRRHAAVTGTLPAAAGPFAAGSAYRANEVDALRWVHATLVGTALAVAEPILGSLAPAERERYWAEARLFGALFGLPPGSLPVDWAGFEAYLAGVAASGTLAVGPEARAVAAGLLRRRGLRPGAPGWYLAVTAHLLPPPVRDGFGLAYGPRERRAAARVLAAARALVPRLPPRVRFVGPYQEAVARLAGRPRPDLGVRLANRLWIGRPRLEG